MSLETRVKQTFACEHCRKRKAKCSGSPPCTLCQKTGQECTFVYQRQRRGRKSKNSFFNASLHTRSPDDPATIIHFPIPLRHSESSTDSWPPQLQHMLIEDLANQTAARSHDPQELTRLIAHLLDLFFSLVAPQFFLFIRESDFRQRIIDARCPAHLCYALSIVSLQWSSHRSIHDAHVRSRITTLFNSLVRDGLQSHLVAPHLLPALQSYCAMIVHNTCRGNALQAWCDIGAATSIARLLIPQSQGHSTGLEAEAVELATHFLSLSELLLSIGHPQLSTSTGSKHCDVASAARLPDYESTSRLFQTCSVLAQIHSEARLGFSNHRLPPWMSKSTFMSLRQSLDRMQLSWPENLSSRNLDILHLSSEENSLAQEWLAVLTWHAAVILLNNVFLPIPTAATEETINFPRAPETFLRERITACEASAMQIARICRNIMSQGVVFLAPLLGYSCFQAALVFLNQLERSRLSVSSELMLHLEVTLAMLDGMRNFFRPAIAWTNVITKIRALPPIVGTELHSHSDLFNGFAARFPGISMPAVISFESSDEDDPAEEQVATSPVQSARVVDTPLEDEPEHEWMLAYEDHLDSDLTTEELAEHPRPYSRDTTAADYDTTLEPMSNLHLDAGSHFVGEELVFSLDDMLQEPTLGSFAVCSPSLDANHPNLQMGTF